MRAASCEDENQTALRRQEQPQEASAMMAKEKGAIVQPKTQISKNLRWMPKISFCGY
jgi:hypothetical protein